MKRSVRKKNRKGISNKIMRTNVYGKRVVRIRDK